MSITVRVPVIEIKPVIKNWLSDIYIWSPEIESRCFVPEGRKIPCLCLADEILIQECLESKIAGDTAPEIMRAFLLSLLLRGHLPHPDKIYIDHLKVMGLIRITEHFVSPEPLLSTWPVPYLLRLAVGV